MATIDAEALARRARCLYAMYLRGCAERKLTQRGHGFLPTCGGSAQDWLSLCDKAVRDPALVGSFSEAERSLMKIKGGKMRVFQGRYCVYCAHSLDMLAQALGAQEREVDSVELSYIASTLTPEAVLGNDPPAWLASPQLISLGELHRLESITSAYAWRLRLHVLTLTVVFRESPHPFTPDKEKEEFVARVIAEGAERCAEVGLFLPIRGDFPMGKYTFGEYISRKMVTASNVEAMTSQRVRAVRWMMDGQGDWDLTRGATPQEFTIPEHLRGSSYPSCLEWMFDPDVDTDSFRYM